MPGAKHGYVASNACYLFTSHVKANKIGRVMSNDSFVQTGRQPDTVRGADLFYISYERLPQGEVPSGLTPLPPELVVEVVSPTDRWSQIFVKIGDYLQAGVSAVVVLDPKTATASVYRADEIQQVLDNGDELTIPDVLPGFSVPVKRFFE